MRNLPRREAERPRRGASIAGHHANYIVRQLYFFQDGSRSGRPATLMQGVVQKLSVDDMVIAALPHLS